MWVSQDLICDVDMSPRGMDILSSACNYVSSMCNYGSLVTCGSLLVYNKPSLFFITSNSAVIVD